MARKLFQRNQKIKYEPISMWGVLEADRQLWMVMRPHKSEMRKFAEQVLKKTYAQARVENGIEIVKISVQIVK